MYIFTILSHVIYACLCKWSDRACILSLCSGNPLCIHRFFHSSKYNCKTSVQHRTQETKGTWLLLIKQLCSATKQQVTYSLYAQIKCRGHIWSVILLPCAVRMKVVHSCTLWQQAVENCFPNHRNRAQGHSWNRNTYFLSWDVKGFTEMTKVWVTHTAVYSQYFISWTLAVICTSNSISKKTDINTYQLSESGLAIFYIQ